MLQKGSSDIGDSYTCSSLARTSLTLYLEMQEITQRELFFVHVWCNLQEKVTRLRITDNKRSASLSRRSSYVVPVAHSHVAGPTFAVEGLAIK